MAASKKTGKGRKPASTSKRGGKKTVEKKKTAVYDFPIVREIIVLVCVALAAILFISSFDGIESDLGWLKQVNFGLFGWFGYVSAAVMIFLSFFIAANIDHFGMKPRIKVIGIGIFVIAACGFLQDVQIDIYDYTMSVTDYFAYGYEYGGGGLIGGAVMKLLYPFLGKIGSGILLFFVLLISLMIVTEISFQDIRQWILAGIEKNRQRRQQRLEREEQYVAELQRRQTQEKKTDKKNGKKAAIANVDLKKEGRTAKNAPPGADENQSWMLHSAGKKSQETEPAEEPRETDHEEVPAAAETVIDENRKHAFFEWIQQRRKEEKQTEEEFTIEEPEQTEAFEKSGKTEERILHAASNGGNRQLQQEREQQMLSGKAVQTKISLAETETQEPVEYNPYADLPEQTADKYSNTAYHEGAVDESGTMVVETAGGKKIVVEKDTVIAPTKKRTITYVGSTEKEAAAAVPKPAPKPYVAPALKLLKRTEAGKREKNRDMELAETAALLEQTFRDFGVGVEVTDYSCGPTVTRYELTPAQGVKVSRITALTDDVKLKLAATDIRIEAPIPGKSAVGIEVPNKENSVVLLGDLISSSSFQKHPSKLAFAVGKDIGGKVIVFDIARMPHLLIAGATGSGKSVCINTLIMSILYKATPDDVKLIMIDPKVVELSVYNGIPHLAKPVVTDAKKASGVLNWAVAEMTRRYHKFAETNTRDIAGYNNHIAADESLSEEEKKTARLPQMVIIVDELADLMMVAPGEVEDAICRLAQMARAAGIHLVLATQRPSVNVITGLIKANVPSRIAFSVSSGVDSRTIIDMNGAEKLLGKGDMLFYPFGYNKPVRVQGAFVSDQEVSGVVESLTKSNDTYVPAAEFEDSFEEEEMNEAGEELEVDEYFGRAGLFLIEKEKGSIGMLQRMFRIGFNRAARIMDQLAECGVVGEEEGTKPRQILMTQAEFEAFLAEKGLS